ncbi:MAG TPA: ribosome silencing factor [Candidatus Angelobacter sp.]|nr:ribosome silencing factor [Candidatus Angelobacter sp.]
MIQNTRQQVAQAVRAVENKKGEDVSILEMDKNAGAFTDYFVVCTGTNPRQIQAIADEIEHSLEQDGSRPTSREGYGQAEWVLLDYVDFVVHIFSEKARKFYDLERLWKSAKRVSLADLSKKPVVEKKKAPVKKAVKVAAKSAGKKAAGKSASVRKKKSPAARGAKGKTSRAAARSGGAGRSAASARGGAAKKRSGTKTTGRKRK